MIKLTINGNKKEFPEGKTLLECIQNVGIKVPTLCHHKALEPYGACRLCLVEVEQAGRAPSIQASCCYPALDGLSVKTDTERVEKTRKVVIELLLARCPDSEVVQKLAADLGVKEVRIKKKDDDCIYCGLCVRMCEERMGRSAVGITGRGPKRQVESPFAKNSEECWVCRACDFICPTGKTISTSSSDKESRPIPDEFNIGLNTRSSVYLMYPQMIPNKPVIDKNTCVHLNYDKCGVCKEICEAEAINYEDEDKTVEFDVGAVILTPGYEVYDATASEEYGYGRYPNVINSLEFERILSASGPFEGHVQRPYDKKTPERIAFIQCVGSRDSERDYCSAVCCMYATKEAVIAKEHVGEKLECDIYFMDLRAFGKGFEEYYQRAKEQGINYIRCRPPTVKEIQETRNLIIEYLTEDDKKVSQEYDMVILAIGIQPPRSVNEIAGRFQIGLNQFNFCKTSAFNPAESSRDGIYVAGAFTEPKDIPDTVMQASAAASNALALLCDVRGSLIKPEVYPPEKDVTGQEPRVGVFVCHCGVNIASVVNVPDVVEYAKTLPNIVFAQNNLYTCSGDSCENIKNMIKEHDLNRVVVASCTPRTHEPLFRSVLQEAGLNPYLFEMANIRDQCSWVHMHEPERATKKSKDLLRMAVAKARLLEPLYKGKLSINRSALVIGGGLAGMVAALQIANQGFEVYLVEKEIQLGGNLRRIHYLLNGEKPQKQLESLIAKVKGNSRIHLFTNAVINSVEGSIGKFKTEITVNHQEKGTNQEIEHGVVIVATGAKEYRPEEYLYGEDERVITQLELEERLVGSSEPRTGKQKPKTIVMIQCVGSRDEQRPYCSKVCCSEAVKNALKIKETAPDTSVYILYRDIRTYGFKESYYTKAREEGIAFIRYDEDRKPEVSRNGASLQVRVFDQVLKMRIKIPADLVVLSAGTVAENDNEAVAQLLKVPLTPDKFFLEAHMKLRPVDFATDGVFSCGLAHSAKSIEESIIQAQASAARASTIISKDIIELEANISYVVDENCDGCAYCIDPCPYQALTLIEYMRKGALKKTVEANDGLCKGCGTCMATCPKKGIFVKGFKLEQIGAQVDAVLEAEI